MKILAQGDIALDDLSNSEKRTFHQELVFTSFDLSGKEIMWNFRGEIFDAALNEKYEPMFMQGEKFDNTIEGVGFHIQINENKSFKIKKKVYRNGKQQTK